jgi:hypothetical protein
MKVGVNYVTTSHYYNPEGYRVSINYRRISLRHNLSRKCRKIVTFVDYTHSERNIFNGPIVATAIGNVTQDMLVGMGVSPGHLPCHTGRTANAFKVTVKLQTFLLQMVVTSCILFSVCKNMVLQYHPIIYTHPV